MRTGVGGSMGAGASTKNKGALPKAEIRLSFLLSGHASHADVADRIFDALAANIDGRVALQELRQYLISRDMWCKQSDVEALCAAIGASPAGITREQLRAGLDSDAGGKPPLLWLMALNPPPAGVGVFADLVRSDGPIDIADSAFRAITICQLKAVLAHAERRCEDEGWLGKRFDAGTHRYELLAADEANNIYKRPLPNLYDLASHVISPATHDHRLPDGSTQPSFVELIADGPQRPSYFVSHFWGEPVKHFVGCLARHVNDRTNGEEDDGTCLWVCAYATRQWSLATDDPSQASFHRALQLSFGTIAIIDKAAHFFDRVWCCYEMYESLTMQEGERDVTARANGRHTFDVYRTSLDTQAACRIVEHGVVAAGEAASTGGVLALARWTIDVKLQSAKASVDADRRRILNSVVGGGRDLSAEVLAQHPQYEEVNATLRQFVEGLRWDEGPRP